MTSGKKAGPSKPPFGSASRQFQQSPAMTSKPKGYWRASDWIGNYVVDTSFWELVGYITWADEFNVYGIFVDRRGRLVQPRYTPLENSYVPLETVMPMHDALIVQHGLQSAVNALRRYEKECDLK